MACGAALHPRTGIVAGPRKIVGLEVEPKLNQPSSCDETNQAAGLTIGRAGGSLPVQRACTRSASWLRTVKQCQRGVKHHLGRFLEDAKGEAGRFKREQHERGRPAASPRDVQRVQEVRQRHVSGTVTPRTMDVGVLLTQRS